MFLLASLVQNVWRSVCGVICGKGLSLWCLLYFFIIRTNKAFQSSYQLVCIFANYPFTPIYIRDCKETEYFEDMQSPQIGIFATHSFPNTNYLLLIYNRRLGWLFFF